MKRILLAVLVAWVCVSPAVQAAETVRAGQAGLSMTGQIMEDKTLLAAFYRDLDGALPPLSGVDTLKSPDIWFGTYAPIEPGARNVTLTWAVRETETSERVVNGSVKESTSTTWRPVRKKTVSVPASDDATLATHVELPDVQESRLTMRYGPSGETIWQGQYNQSIVYQTTPPQTVQEEFLQKQNVLLSAAVVAILAMFGSWTLWRRAGRDAWKITFSQGVVLLGLFGALLAGAWGSYREEILLHGTLPGLTALGLLVAVVNLQWRDFGGQLFAFHYLDTQEEADEIEEDLPTLRVPDHQALAPDEEEGYLYEITDGTLAGFLKRSLLGQRRFIKVPEGRNWWFKGRNAPYSRRYILTERMPKVRHPEGLHLVKPPGAWLPRVRYEATAVTELPVGPSEWKSKSEVIQNFEADLETARTIEELQRENNRLRAREERGIAEGVKNRLRDLKELHESLRHGRSPDWLTGELDESEAEDEGDEPGATAATQGGASA